MIVHAGRRFSDPGNRLPEGAPQDCHNFWPATCNVLSYSGLNDDALTAYSKSIEMKPDSQNVWYKYGATLSELGWGEDAVEAYDMVLELIPYLRINNINIRAVISNTLNTR